MTRSAEAAALAPCPHCGRQGFWRAGQRIIHMRHCAQNPDRASGPNSPGALPTLAVACRHCGRADFLTVSNYYAHQRACARRPAGVDPLAPCPRCGRADFVNIGGRTNHVKRCGATPPPRQPRPPRVAPPRKDPREPCPHCGRDNFGKRSSRQMHILYCAENPARRDGPVVRLPPPTTATPCPHCGLTFGWPSLRSRAQHVRACRANPARSVRGAPSPAAAPTCAHCGEVFERLAWKVAHERRCAQNPAVALARGRAAMEVARAAAPAAAGPYVCPVCHGTAHAEAIGGGRCAKCKREGRS